MIEGVLEFIGILALSFGLVALLCWSIEIIAKRRQRADDMETLFRDMTLDVKSVKVDMAALLDRVPVPEDPDE